MHAAEEAVRRRAEELELEQKNRQAGGAEQEAQDQQQDEVTPDSKRADAPVPKHVLTPSNYRSDRPSGKVGVPQGAAFSSSLSSMPDTRWRTGGTTPSWTDPYSRLLTGGGLGLSAWQLGGRVMQALPGWFVKTSTLSPQV